MAIFVHPRWQSAAVNLDFMEPQIAPFDPPTPKTLVHRTNHGVDGSDAPLNRLRDIRPFKLYCDLETVGFKIKVIESGTI